MAEHHYADQDLHGNKISALADGQATTDAVNKGQLDAVQAAIPRITVSRDAPADPQVNDLWVDLN